MQTLEQKILQVLENNDGRCLDNEDERQALCDALFEMMDRDYEWATEPVSCGYCDAQYTLDFDSETGR